MKRRESLFATHGLEHPAERFEFARFCLLNHYIRNADFAAELEQIAVRHRETLEAVARQRSWGIRTLADYRSSWGMLSFLARDQGPGEAPRPLKGSIESYRAELRDFAARWGLAADWCAPSLDVSLLASNVFRRSSEDRGRIEDAAMLFIWDLERQGRPPTDTVVTLPRLLLQSDAPGRQVDIRLITSGGENAYYDPRMDRWEDSLARARTLLGVRRLSSTTKETLLRRRREIEDVFAAEGYTARRKPRRVGGRHALARWTYWAYLAICPPRRSTAEIITLIGRRHLDTQHVDRAIKNVLELLRLPPRLARPR